MKCLILNLILPVLTAILLTTYLNAVPLNPYINSVSPDINSLNAGSSENVIISFTQDMNPATINNTGIQVYGLESGMMATVISYSALTKSAVIDPVKNFRTGEQICVILNSNIKTVSNISIDPFSFIFTADVPRGDGNFGSSIVSTGVMSSGDFLSGDFDGDGVLDLISINKETHTASFLKNDGSGLFNLNNSFLIDTVIIQSYSSADYDNDGDLDLAFVIGEYFFFDIQIFLNNGNGTFASGFRHGINYGRGGTPLIRSSDIDNDGDIDIIPCWKDRFSGGISFILNNGNAVFTSGGTLGQYFCYAFPLQPLAGWINSFEIADINNDGSMDAIIESIQIGFDTACQCAVECYKIKVAVNNGHGAFTELITYSFTESHSINFVGDYNNDGYTDLICRGMLMKNNGNGFFTTSPLSIYTGGVTGDFESDGDLDIITHEANSVNVYKNNGDASFGSPVSFSTETGAGSLTYGNFDNDCDLDIVYGVNSNGNVVAMLNSSETDYCSLTGQALNIINTGDNLYTTSDINGYWEIINVPPCNATINGSIQDDSVFVNAGPSPGEYVLYHHSFDDCGWKSCSKSVSVDNPLPVELSAFVFSVNGNDVVLNWITASEINNSGFEIERVFINGLSSSDWLKIDFIQGHGTTSLPNNYEYSDRNLSSGKYKYRLKQIDFNGSFEYYNLSNEVVIGVPDIFELSQNYPNPFNPVTHLEFGIPDLGFVSLKVYDAVGKEIAILVNEINPAGRYEIMFDGSNLASGVYYYKLESGNFRSVKKMILIR